MSIISKVRRQTCVYWPRAGFSEFGYPKFGSARELSCRWDDQTEEIIAADGTRRLSQAQVMVGEDLQVGGFLMLGTLADVTDFVSPSNNSGAWEIVRLTKNPNMRATEFLRIAYL
jgi:hypothetical protein